MKSSKDHENDEKSLKQSSNQSSNQSSGIDAYISSFPTDIQARLHAVRAAIREAAPEASEKISYQMPTFYLNGNLVHFAAMKHHIGFYPSPSGIDAFSEQLKPYKSSKGAVQFAYTEDIPYELIKEIVRYRVQENLAKK